LDVYNRVSSFIPTLVRDLDRHRRSGIDVDNLNVVIVTHGLALRLFLSELFQVQIAYHIIFCHAHFVSHQSYTDFLVRWFQWSVACFEESQNPDNCELVTMNKRKDSEGHAWMELEEKDRMNLCLPIDCSLPRNVQLHRMQNRVKPS